MSRWTEYLKLKIFHLHENYLRSTKLKMYSNFHRCIWNFILGSLLYWLNLSTENRLLLCFPEKKIVPSYCSQGSQHPTVLQAAMGAWGTKCVGMCGVWVYVSSSWHYQKRLKRGREQAQGDLGTGVSQAHSLAGRLTPTPAHGISDLSPCCASAKLGPFRVSHQELDSQSQSCKCQRPALRQLRILHVSHLTHPHSREWIYSYGYKLRRIPNFQDCGTRDLWETVIFIFLVIFSISKTMKAINKQVPWARADNHKKVR